MSVVSVVIPARNAEHTIAACIGSVLACDPRPVEVIVVDDVSDDATAEVAAAAGAVVVRSLAHLGPGGARNVGARRALGTLVAFTDADCEVTPDWLASLLSVLDAGVVGATGGYLEPSSGSAVPWFMHANITFTQGRAGRLVATPISSNLLVRREEFLRCGGFPETRSADGGPEWGCEDFELGHRMRTAFARDFAWVTPSGVRHAYRPTWRGYWRQQAWYCRALTVAMASEPEVASSAGRIGRTDGPALAAGTTLGTVGLVIGLRYRRFGLVAGAALLPVAAGAARARDVLERRRRDGRHEPSTLVAAVGVGWFLGSAWVAGTAWGCAEMARRTARRVLR